MAGGEDGDEGMADDEVGGSEATVLARGWDFHDF